MCNLGAAKVQMALVQESRKEASMSTSKEVHKMYKLAADQCVVDSDKAQFLLWSDTVKAQFFRRS
ncbi:hypothetical protein MKW92_024858, partial [Papaver armeniacum]